MIWTRLRKVVAKTTITALVLGALATSGKSQNVYQGKFTLPVQTHWGNATLPAGDYTFSVLSANEQYRLYIHGQRTNFIVSAITAETASPQHTQLNLIDVADVYAIQTFDAPELRLTFTYWTPTQKHTSSQEARQKNIPQAAPATQVTENRTSIAVYATGR
jgi:hypothetical protein